VQPAGDPDLAEPFGLGVAHTDGMGAYSQGIMMLALARSEDPEAFNFGSAPGERVIGGAAIKRLFGRLRAELRLHDGARVAQVDANVGWAAVNVDFTSKSRAATDVTQTFRVLAVLLREGETWRIVQTHWSNGGPIR